MITVDQTTRSYSGKPGCMCGCLGTYNTSERARKIAITQLLKDPNVEFDTWSNGEEGCLSVRTATRQRALYLNARGVAAARAMGLGETVL